MEVEEVLEDLTESLTLVWSFEMVAFQISSERTSLSSSKNFVLSTEALQKFLYTRHRVFFRSFPFHIELLKEISSSSQKKSSVRKASGHIVDLRSNFSRDNKPFEFRFLSVSSAWDIALYKKLD